MSTFAGAASLPIHVALERGYFAASGLDVEVVETRRSDDLMSGLVSGAFQIVHAAPDNVVAWSDREDVRIAAWIGLASGPVSLVAAPEVHGVADLRGKTIAVDAVQSGFVSVLHRMLARDGLTPGDVVLEPIGATQLRLDALLEGSAAATILTLPWALTAADRGYVALAEQSEVVPRLQGSCGASRSDWLASHHHQADAYLRAVVAAITWLYLPQSRDTVQALVRERFSLTAAHAVAVCDAFLNPAAGWPPSAMIDPVGMALVCALRGDGDARARHAPERYYTLEPYGRIFGSKLLGTAPA